MGDKQLTNRIAGLIFVSVLLLYFSTMASTTSFWDCGEFIASAFTMAVPHPPGSPLFILLGRAFSLLPSELFFKALHLVPEFTDKAFRVNLMSPIAGALSALFCYLVILRLIRGWEGKLAKPTEGWSDHLGAIVGTFIFAMADSNWFNAVEAEVYAYAIFLMMLALHLGIRWADTAGKPVHLSLALFLAYLFGLAGGLHLLCLLVLPSIALLGLFTYVKDRRDASVILLAVAMMGIGGYFALHFQNATRLIADRLSEPASTYGISDDPYSYRDFSIAIAVLFGAGGIIASFMTRTVKPSSTWTVFLIGAAAVGTVRSALDIFFWVEDVGPFPTAALILTIAALTGLWFLSHGSIRPIVPTFKGYHLAVGLLLLVVVGYSTYLMLMIRSGLDPAIDENNPENWVNFFNFIARKQYGTEDMSMVIFNRRANLHYQFWDMFVKYLLQQFPASLTGALFDWKIPFRYATENRFFLTRVPDVPLVLMFLGIVWHAEGDWKRFLAMLTLWGISGIGLGIYLNMPDPQPRERHYVFTGATSVMAMWMGMGVTGLVRSISASLPENVPEFLRRKVAPYAMAGVGISVPLAFLTGHALVDEYSIDHTVRYSNFARQNRTNDTIGYDYAYNILQSCEQDAVLFTNGDNDTFPLWYMQEVLEIRKDVRVVNLSLLNTDWYIEQLRDFVPTVPGRDEVPKIAMHSGYTDDYIENVLCGTTLETLRRANRIDVGPDGRPFGEDGRLIGWKSKEFTLGAVDTVYMELNDGRVVRGKLGPTQARGIEIVKQEGSVLWDTVRTSDIRFQLRGNEFPGIEFTFPRPSDTYSGVLRVQDVMVYNLAHWAMWERPIYFAVTVSESNRIGLDRYLRMEGMALRLEQEEDPLVAAGRSSYGLNAERSLYNLENVYRIRHLQDKSIYKDDNMLKLISNYRSAYLQLADTQVRMDSVAAGRRTLEQLNEKIPLAWRASRSAAMIARGAGDEMADLRDLYIRQMTDVMERKLATVDIYDIYVHQEVELTWQLLRFIGEHERALDLMIAAEKHLRNPTMLSRLNAVDRVVLLFHAANVAGDDLADFDQASILLEQCQAATRRIPRAAQAEQQFRNELRLSRTAFEGEVQRRIIELQRKQSEADTFHMSE